LGVAFNRNTGQGIPAEVNDLRRSTMKLGIEDTIAKAIRKHAHFDSMSPMSWEVGTQFHRERAHIALWMLWQSLADQLGMDDAVINNCRTAEENRAFLIKCGIAEDVVRSVIMYDDENWGGY
jgi:hypothetical protein